MKKIDLPSLLFSPRHLLLLLLLPLLFALTTLTANAQRCWTPNCSGALGYDIKTGQVYSKLDYGSQTAAWNEIKKECPGCSNESGVMFTNTCGALAYSASHNFVTWGWADDGSGVAEDQAMSACWRDVKKLSLEKTSGDRRKSNRRPSEQGSCKIVASACTTREYTQIYWY